MAYGNRAGVGASTVGIAFDISNIAGNSDITWNGVTVGSMTSIERVTFLGSAVNDVVKGGGSLDSLRVIAATTSSTAGSATTFWTAGPETTP